MDFEHDPEKSRSNLQRHGFDLECAQALWDDPRALVVAARSIDEERFIIMAEFHGKIWTSIFTVRESRIRIISARRSRDEEEEKYNHS